VAIVSLLLGFQRSHGSDTARKRLPIVNMAMKNCLSQAGRVTCDEWDHAKITGSIRKRFAFSNG